MAIRWKRPDRRYASAGDAEPVLPHRRPRSLTTAAQGHESGCLEDRKKLTKSVGKGIIVTRQTMPLPAEGRQPAQGFDRNE